MTPQDELVSVIIPTYNRENTLRDSIASVLGQSYSNLEVIVVDDGSTDNTKDIISEIKDRRLVYIYQDNKGACVARNKGIDKSRGDFIAFQDSDDIWNNEKLEKEIQTIKNYDADIVGCRMHNLHSNSITPKTINEGFVTEKTNLFGLGTQTLLFRKSVLTNVRFSDSMKRLQDLELLIRCFVLNFRIYILKDALVQWRIQNDSISNNNEKLLSACNELLDNYEMYIDKLPNTFSNVYNFKGMVLEAQGKSGKNEFYAAYKLVKNRDNMIKYLLSLLRITKLIY